MEVALLIVHVITSIALVIVILLQSGKGGGLGGGFGGASAAATQIFGGRGAGNFLSRTTVGLAAVFMATSLTLAYISSQPRSLMDLEEGDGVTGPAEEEIIERGSGAPEQGAAPVEQAPTEALPEPTGAAEAVEGADVIGDDTDGESGGEPATEEEAAPVETDEASDDDAAAKPKPKPGAGANDGAGSPVNSAPEEKMKEEAPSDSAPGEKAKRRQKKETKGAAAPGGGDTVEANAEEETILGPAKDDAPGEDN